MLSNSVDQSYVSHEVCYTMNVLFLERWPKFFCLFVLTVIEKFFNNKPLLHLTYYFDNSRASPVFLIGSHGIFVMPLNTNFGKGHKFLAVLYVFCVCPSSIVRRPFYTHIFMLLSFQSLFRFLTSRNVPQ